MDQSDSNPKTYAELIEQGKQYAEYGRHITFEVYDQALQLVDDKFEVYILIAQAHIIQRNDYQVKQNLALASNYANNNIDRHLQIASLYEQINFKWHAIELYGLINDLDPQSGHKGPSTYEDYEQILNEYYDEQRLQFASKSIEKLIELSDNKAADLTKIGSRILLNDSLSEQADQYFIRASEYEQNKYDNLMQIGDIYYDLHIQQKALQFYLDASKLRPEEFKTHLKVIESKLKLQLYQDALDYIQNIQIPEVKDIYINLGLIFSNYNQTADQAQNYLLKGVDLSENRYETLIILIEKLQGQQVNGILLQKAIEINGNDLELAISYAQHMLITQNSTQQAIDAYKKYMSLDPGDCFYIDPLIKVYKQLGRIDEAIDFLRQFNLVSKRYNSFLELGELLLNQKQIDEALKYLNQALELDKAHSYDSIVKMLFQNQYYDECIQFCTEYNLFDHYSRSSYYYKAYSLMKLDKDLQDALDLLNFAQKIQYQYDTQDLVDLQFIFFQQEQRIKKRISEQQKVQDQEQS